MHIIVTEKETRQVVRGATVNLEKLLEEMADVGVRFALEVEEGLGVAGEARCESRRGGRVSGVKGDSRRRISGAHHLSWRVSWSVVGGFSGGGDSG